MNETTMDDQSAKRVIAKSLRRKEVVNVVKMEDEYVMSVYRKEGIIRQYVSKAVAQWTMETGWRMADRMLGTCEPLSVDHFHIQVKRFYTEYGSHRTITQKRSMY